VSSTPLILTLIEGGWRVSPECLVVEVADIDEPFGVDFVVTGPSGRHVRIEAAPRDQFRLPLGKFPTEVIAQPPVAVVGPDGAVAVNIRFIMGESLTTGPWDIRVLDETGDHTLAAASVDLVFPKWPGRARDLM
jgi:hypothetical protein